MKTGVLSRDAHVKEVREGKREREEEGVGYILRQVLNLLGICS